MRNTLPSNTPGMDEKVAAAAATLMANVTNLMIVEYGAGCLGGKPGVVAASDKEIRFVDVHFEDVRDAHACDSNAAMPEADEADQLVADAHEYIERHGLKIGDRKIAYDRIDITVLDDGQAAVRRIEDVVENRELPNKDFEARFLQDLARKIDNGEEIPEGHVYDDDGKLTYEGDFI